MGRVYRGSFWRDGLWLLTLPGLIGAALSLAAAGGTVALVSLARAGEMSWQTAVLTLTFACAPALVGGFACLYTLWGGLGERLEVVGDTLSYRAPLFRRLIPVRDIIVVERWPRPRVRYVAGPVVRAVTLPNWNRGEYLERLLEEMRAVKPDLAVVDFAAPTGFVSAGTGAEAIGPDTLLRLKAMRMDKARNPTPPKVGKDTDS